MSIDYQQDLIKQGDRLAARARRWMFWERFAPVFAIAAVFIAIFIAGSFAGVWQRIGDPWRLIALITAVVLLVRAVLKARLHSIPTQSDAERRVEQDSGVPHRPLQTLKDSPAKLTAEPNSSWESHVARAAKSAAHLNPAKPIPVIAPRDKYFLRFAMPAVLVLAGLVGFGDNFDRLRSALSPTWQSGMNSANVTFDAWVDPPNYTGRPPVYFKGKGRADIPAGSELVARITGIKDAPRLKLTSKGRSKYLPLKRLGPKSFEARTVLKTDTKAQWRVGTRTKSWNVTVTADTPPTLEINTPAAVDKRDRLAMTYSFEDDYGVTDLALSMRLLTTPAETARQEDYLSVSIPLPSSNVRKADKRDSALDMTKHIWTGRKVAGRLIATDGLGQSVQSEEMFFTIPDKIFVEPMAKAIIEHRALLLSAQNAYEAEPRRTRKEWANMPIFDNWETEDRMGRAPTPVQRTAVLIDALTDRPEGLFEDPALYMGLRYVSGRLRQARAQDELNGLPEYLWELAIRAEFGVLGTALEEMREAEEALQEGMARRAEQREIDTLFERYDVAVERYLEEMRENAEVVDAEGGGGEGKNVDEIEALLKAIEEANRIGDTEGARRALQQLAALLENMNMQLAKGGSGGDGEPSEGEMSEEMEESLEELADLLGKQRELKDETQQAERSGEQSGEQNGEPEGGSEGQSQGQSGEGENSGDPQSGEDTPGTPSPEDLARTQQQLAELLEQALEGLPEESLGQTGISQGGQGDNENTAGGSGGEDDPDADQAGASGDQDGEEGIAPEDALDEAARAMAEAENALNSGNLEDAAKAQAAAIQALRDAAQSLAQQVGDRRSGEGDQDGKDGEGNPLGAQEDGENDGNTQADIDQRDNATRSRELLEELRRRAAEQERDQIERDYLERLLKRF